MGRDTKARRHRDQAVGILSSSRACPVQALLGPGFSCRDGHASLTAAQQQRYPPPNALGTEALLRISSAPLPSFQLLSSASKFRKHPISHDLRIRAGTSSTSTRPLRVRIRSNARTCALAGKRARAWHQAMQSLKQRVAHRMALRAADPFWRARLRFQCLERVLVCGKASLHPP
jgi:hypothetical protein